MVVLTGKANDGPHRGKGRGQERTCTGNVLGGIPEKVRSRTVRGRTASPSPAGSIRTAARIRTRTAARNNHRPRRAAKPYVAARIRTAPRRTARPN